MKLSIITATYNSAATLADTLECIQNQDHPDIEHIIIDGGSADDTINIIKRYSHISRFVSEKDNGIYDAMNKGIAIAGGDIIGILNSDDVYASPGILSLVAKTFEEDPQAMALYADLQFVQRDDMSKVVRSWRAGKYTKSSFYYGWMPPHPTFFVRREVYDKVGTFNINLGSAADYELMLRILLKHNIKAAYINKVIIKMRVGGVSTGSLKNRIKANRQDRMAWKINNLKPFPFTLYLKPMRKLGQFFIK
ncbi:glycosyl transferase [Terrimonas sp.]|uniref:glycosyltransferase family 2 protein n=1 Tax=Terrimonas sp. TaxID=1914338 RepID=UPI000D52231C|nr:glycosyltransferase family 2 protein [Terrimonas sp.]PVD52037.1 glycosyl transferase [Terrimonas sp.]